MTPTALAAVLALATGAAGQILLPPTGAPVLPGSALPTPTGSQSQLAADLNDDGYPDVVLADFELRVALNNGLGVLVPAGQTAHGPRIDDLAAGDFDGDGHTDVVTVGDAWGHLAVYLGTGGGELLPHLALPEVELASTVLLDLNADGALDIVAGFNAAGTMLRLLTNDGAGGFGAPVSFGSAGLVTDLATGDLDLDGDTDLVVAHKGSAMRIVKVAAPGQLQEAGSIPVNAVTHAVGDVDADGWPDVVSRGAALPDPLKYWRSTSGVFPVTATKSWNISAGVVALADLAADGKPEIVVEENPGLSIAKNTDGVPGSFANYQMALGSFPSIDAADFDGDGRDDILVSRSNIYGCAILFSSQTGDLQLPVQIPVPNATHPEAMTAADLDGDGLQDVVVANLYQTAFQVGRATGPTSFSFTSIPTQLATWPDVHLADITNDGNLDVVFTASAPNELLPNSIVVHAGDGAASFGGPLPSSFTEYPYRCAPADFDSDGLLDVAVLCHDVGPEAMLRKGDGSGTFAPWSTTPIGVGSGSGRLAVADVNGDGSLDLVVCGGHDLDVSLGDGAGGLAPPLSVLEDPGLWEPVQARDLDVDGDIDLAAAWYGDASVAVVRNDGGSFAPPALGGLASAFVTDMACGDVDGDGALDLVQGTDDYVLMVVPTDGACGLRPASAHPSGKFSERNGLVLRDLDGNGCLDVIALYDGIALNVHLGTGGAADPWISVGGGVDGDAGQPRLRGTGDPVAGQLVHCDVDFAPPLAPAALVVGLELQGLPFKGGLVVPAPELILFVGVTSAAGELALADDWPSGVPGGVEIWLQAWFVDTTAPHGLSATGGLRLLVP